MFSLRTAVPIMTVVPVIVNSALFETSGKCCRVDGNLQGPLVLRPLSTLRVRDSLPVHWSR